MLTFPIGVFSLYVFSQAVRRRVLDVANTLGLSNTVMRLIENRSHQDMWIFWVGAFVSLLLMYLLYYYFKIME